MNRSILTVDEQRMIDEGWTPPPMRKPAPGEASGRLGAHGRLEAALTDLDTEGSGMVIGPWHVATAMVEADPALAEAIELGLAWNEALSLLPEGYALMLRGALDWSRGPIWKMSAYTADGRRKQWDTEGTTPTAALRALTLALRRFTERRIRTNAGPLLEQP